MSKVNHLEEVAARPLCEIFDVEDATAGLFPGMLLVCT